MIQRIKPARWPFDPVLVASEWRGFARAARVVVMADRYDPIGRLAFTATASDVIGTYKGPALDFTGAGGSRIQAAGLGRVPTAYPFTVVALLRQRTRPDYACIVQVGDQSTGGGWEVAISGGGGGSFYDNESEGTEWGSEVPVGPWCLVATTLVSSTSRYWYVRRYDTGALVGYTAATNTVGLTQPAAANIRVGASDNPGGGWWDVMDGSVLVAAVYNGALGQAQLDKLFIDPFGPFRMGQRRWGLKAAPVGGTLALDQSRFRWRNDDDNEANATWAEAEGVDETITPGGIRRLRMQIAATGDPASAAYKLQARKQGTTPWDDVTVE